MVSREHGANPPAPACAGAGVCVCAGQAGAKITGERRRGSGEAGETPTGGQRGRGCCKGGGIAARGGSASYINTHGGGK